MLAIDQQLRGMLRTPGVCSVYLVNWRSGRVLSSIGSHDPGVGSDTTAILQSLNDGPLCITAAVEDVIVTNSAQHLLYAVVCDSDLCVRVRMERDRNSLGLALRRLRDLANTIEVPPSHDVPRLPTRRGTESPILRQRDPGAVDQHVLKRVLAALRTLSVGWLRTGVMAT